MKIKYVVIELKNIKTLQRINVVIDSSVFSEELKAAKEKAAKEFGHENYIFSRIICDIHI